MRIADWKPLVVCLTLLALTSCDDEAPKQVASSEEPTAETVVQTTAPSSEAPPIRPDDGAEPVPIDEESGWPQFLVSDEPSSDSAADEPQDDVVEGSGDERILTQEERARLRELQETFIAENDDDHGLSIPVIDTNQPESEPVRKHAKFARKQIKAKRAARKSVPIKVDGDGAEPLDDSIVWGRKLRSKRKAKAKPSERRVVPGPSDDDESSMWDLSDTPRGKVDPSLKSSKSKAPADIPQETKRFSTFAVDVDTGSYSLSLGRMRRGYPPRPDTIRVEEWLNTFYYDHDVPDGQDFSIAMEAAPNPFRPDAEEHLLRINIAGKSVPHDARPAAHLTFVIDVSGSMFGPDKLDLIKESLTLLLSKLRPDDTVAIVTYAKETEVVLWPTGASHRDKILNAITGLEPGGSTALDEGLKLGYGLAFRESHYNEGDIHRVVLLGDGRANVGARNVEKLLRPIQIAVDKGVTLSTIGFGAEAFNDELMEQLANRGNGNYAFIDSFRDARRVFGEQLCGTLHVIGKDSKIQVEFNLDRVASWELIGYENRALAKEDFRNDEVDAGEIGAGHQVTALYRVNLRDDTRGPIATTRFRWEDPESQEVSELEATLDTVTDDLREASDDFKFAAAVAATADRFKDQAFTQGVHAGLIAEIAREGSDDDQPARRAFVELLDDLQPFMKK